MPRDRKPLERLRRIIAAWPETAERISHGSPTFWGGKRTFASYHEDHHGYGRLAVWCKSTHGVRDQLVAGAPDLFFVPPYVGPSGWLGICLDRDLDWSAIEDLLEESHRIVAPRRALERLDGS